MTIGERIKAARKKAGLTQAELANKLGIAYQGVAQWENNLRNPKYETLQRLAAALSISVDDLLALTPEDQSVMQYVEDYVVEKTGQNREDVRNDLLADKLAAAPFDAYMEAMDAADAATAEAFRSVSDQQLKEYLLDSYQHLNRRGRIEAVIRIGELEEFPRFK